MLGYKNRSRLGSILTDVFVQSGDCDCHIDGPKRLLLVEGNTCIWTCKHTKQFTMIRTTDWVEKT